MAEDLEHWRHYNAVAEEKIDGANVGIWFDNDFNLKLQSRGHVLHGGAGERQFAPFHGWAAGRHEALEKTLTTRYVLYGEWCFAKNKSYYDILPDWFIGYDVLDRETDTFLATSARDIILIACQVSIVPRLWSGVFSKAPAFGSFLGPSHFKTKHWREVLVQEAARACVKNPMAETDNSDWMEGVYVRVEDDSTVIGRMKLHRDGYGKVSSEHWRQLPLIRNRCKQ
jgi:hypothetical protein